MRRWSFAGPPPMVVVDSGVACEVGSQRDERWKAAITDLRDT